MERIFRRMFVIDSAMNFSLAQVKYDYSLTFDLDDILSESSKFRKTIIDSYIKFLCRNETYVNSKPLNLLQKYKISKNLNYLTFKNCNKSFTKYFEN